MADPDPAGPGGFSAASFSSSGLHDCFGGRSTYVGPLQAVLWGPVCSQARGQAGSAVFVVGNEIVTQASPSDFFFLKCEMLWLDSAAPRS